jgi:hypothetical protein
VHVSVGEFRFLAVREEMRKSTMASAMASFAAIVVAGARVGAAVDAVPPPGDPACRLFQAGAEVTVSSDCIACHSAAGRHGHPVDLVYERAGAQAGGRLRPLAEVVSRGVLVPNGEIRCVTCHDGLSPWKHRVALPPGATPSPAVDPRDPATYETPEGARPPAPGSAVDPKPLCLACHALD